MSRIARPLGIVLAALALAAPAAATVSVSSIGTDGFPTVHAVVVSSAGADNPPVITENGRPVAGLTMQNLGVATAVVLAVDDSHSMAGGPLRDAVAAARGFIAGKPSADAIAVLSFGPHPVSLSSLSTATIDSDAALRNIGLADRPGTALYDAVVAGAEQLRSSRLAGRVLIVLTDGRDVSGTATLATAVRIARESAVSTYPICIEGAGFAAPARAARQGHRRSVLRRSVDGRAERPVQLDRATSRTHVDGLLCHGRAAGRAPGREGDGGRCGIVVVVARRPGPARRRQHTARSVTAPTLVRLPAGGGARRGSRRRTAGAHRVPPAARNTTGTRLRATLKPIPGARATKRVSREQRVAVLTGVFRATERRSPPPAMAVAAEAARARRDAVARRRVCLSALGASLLIGLARGGDGAPPIVILIAMALGPVVPFGVVWFRMRRRLGSFEDQLPDLLITIAASLKAGHSFKQGLQAVVDEGQPPASSEFNRVLTETGLGRSIDDALTDMADRVGSANFEFAITAVTIQRQVGGSLANLFDMVADTVRQRQQFARKISSLTAMGRMSAYTLIGLPFVLALAISVLNRGYLHPLFYSSAAMLLAIAGDDAVGSALLQKIVSFKG